MILSLIIRTQNDLHNIVSFQVINVPIDIGPLSNGMRPRRERLQGVLFIIGSMPRALHNNRREFSDDCEVVWMEI